MKSKLILSINTRKHCYFCNNPSKYGFEICKNCIDDILKIDYYLDQENDINLEIFRDCLSNFPYIQKNGIIIYFIYHTRYKKYNKNKAGGFFVILSNYDYILEPIYIRDIFLYKYLPQKLELITI